MPEGIPEVTVNEEAVNSHLIKTCGEFWNPESVNWDDSWRLLGKRSPKAPDINIYEERGVYILYKDYVPVYVGKGFKTSIGYRLQEHRGDWKKGTRWDAFSWFGIIGLNEDDKIAKPTTVSHQLSSRELVAALEALLIAVIDPRLNARREWLKGVAWLYQSDTDRPIDLETRLLSIEEKLEQILKGKSSTK